MTTRSRQPTWAVGLQAGLAMAAIGTVVSLTGAPPLWGVGAGIVVSVCLLLVEAARPGGAIPGRVMIQLARAAGIAAWLGWCMWPGTQPFAGGPLLAVAAGAQVGAHLGLLQPTRKEKMPGTGLALTSQARLEVEWQARIQRVCRLTVRVDDVTHWDGGAGYTVHLTLPPGGATRRQLAAAVDGLAADARLPEGCSVEVDRGAHRGAAVLRVTTQAPATAVDYPADYTASSILEQAVIGRHYDGSPAGPQMREIAVLAVGMAGSGKTTLLRVLTAAVGRTRDALVWHIDLTGGGLSMDWLTPWLEGESQRPAVDWAVNTVDDALAMVRAAVEISKQRKATGHARKRAANSTLLPIGADMPEIVIVVDEGKTILAPTIRDAKLRELRQQLNTVLDIGRDSGIRPVLSALGATSATLDTAIKAQCHYKVGMRVEKDAELAYLFDWGQASLSDIAGVGSGLAGQVGSPPRGMLTYNLLPDRIIAELAPAVSQRRPELEGAAAHVAGDAYARRYERMRHAFTGGVPVEEDTAEEKAAPVSSVATSGWPDPGDIGRTHAARPALPAGGEAGPPIWRPSPTTHRDLLEDVLAVFDEHGVDLMPRRILAEKLTDGDEDRLRFLLKGQGVVPYHQSFRWSGKTLRGYHRVDVEAARAP